MGVGAAYRLTRPRSYILDWHEPLSAAQQNRATAAFFGVVAILLAAFWTLHHFG